MKLSEHLKQWRIERPDEWKMDEFIRGAVDLEMEIIDLKASLRTCFNTSKSALEQFDNTKVMK